MTMMPCLTKSPAEARLYYWDFAALLGSGGSVVSVVSITQTAAGNVAGSAALSIGAPSVSGTVAYALISGGTDLEDYRLSALVTDDQGNVIDGVGRLQVRELWPL